MLSTSQTKDGKKHNENEALKKGLNMIDGTIVYKAVAETFDLEYQNVDDFLT